MAGWFSRVLHGGERAGSEPVEFSVSCGCGSTVTGVRNKRMQVVVCRKCATQLCILASSPYPRPKVRAAKKKPIKPALKPLRELNEDEVEVMTPPPIPKRGRSNEDFKPVNRPPKPVPKTAFTAKSKRTDKPADNPPEEFAPHVPRARIVTPLRLISLGMIAVIFLAGWWTLHRRAVHQAGLTFAETARAGRAALAKSDYETAELQLRKAVTALDLLGREDREARQVRQLSREATVASHLAIVGLFELIGEARQPHTAWGADIQQALKRTYQDQWFLFDTNGMQFDGQTESSKWSFTLPLIPGDDPVTVRGDLTVWGKQLGDKPPTHLVFAAQIADIRPTAQGETGVELVLNSKTLVLWTDDARFGALGGTADETTLATMKSQAHLLGITE